MSANMLSGSPIKSIIKFGIPIFIGNLFQQVYILVDTFMISASMNNDAVLGIGNAAILYTAILWFIQGMAAGFAVVNAQAYGSGSVSKVRESLAATFALGAVFTALLTLTMLSTLDNTLKAINVSSGAYEYAKDYLKVMYSGIGCTLFFNIFLYSMRSIGDGKSPLIFVIAANIMNILLDYVFVTAMKLGTLGAAYATIISQAAGIVGCLITMLIKFPQFRIKLRDFLSSRKYYIKHFSFALTGAMQVTLIAVTLILQQMAINKQSSDIMIGYVSGYKIDQFAQQIIIAFSLSIATFVGQNYGAKNYGRIKQGVRQGTIFLCILSVFLTAFILLFGKFIALLYLPKATVDIINASQKYLIYQSCFYIIVTLVNVFRNSSQNLGQYALCFLACVMEFAARLSGVILFSNSFDAISLSNVIGWIGSCAVLIPTFIITMHKLTHIKTNKPNIHKLTPVKL